MTKPVHVPAAAGVFEGNPRVIKHPSERVSSRRTGGDEVTAGSGRPKICI
jgi:hypothetical protein